MQLVSKARAVLCTVHPNFSILEIRHKYTVYQRILILKVEKKVFEPLIIATKLN